MKILMITAEMDGIVKTGGLADFALALPKALMARGHEVRVVLPKYKQVVLPGTVPASTPEPVAPASGPAVPTPEPVVPASGPAVPAPELDVPASGPAVPAPELDVPASGPVVPTPEPASVMPVAPSSAPSHGTKTAEAKAKALPPAPRTPGMKTNSLYFNLNHKDRYGCLIYHVVLQGIGVRLVEHHDFFSRDGIYDDGSYAYPDNPLRYAFLCKAALEQCLHEQWIPDVVHCNDWQTALAPYYLKEHYTHHPGLNQARSLLTLHNGAYQGKSDPQWVEALGILPQRFTSELMEEYGLLNLLKCGIMYADAVNAVSPGYCEELLAPETSHGLWHYLNQRKDHFTGILNGCDYSQWNPGTDPFLPHPFSADNMTGKALCKTALQVEMGLPENSGIPLLGLIARLVEQKGFDYLIPALERLLHENAPVQLALLGSGDPEYGSRLHHLQMHFLHKMSFVNGYDNELSHLIEGGADFFMMPSLFEPCGLNQLYSLAYGTLPIVRETGGLKDTVVGLDPDHGNIPPDTKRPPIFINPGTAQTATDSPAFATGISFTHPDTESCYGALKQAISLYLDHPDRYQRMQQQAMGQLFTWDDSAKAYEALYENTMKTT